MALCRVMRKCYARFLGEGRVARLKPYPPGEQWQHSPRLFYWALVLRTNSYYQDNVSLSYTDTSNALTKLKKDPEKPWLKQVSAVTLQQGLRYLNTAFINFFAGRNKYPRFKKKNAR